MKIRNSQVRREAAHIERTHGQRTDNVIGRGRFTPKILYLRKFVGLFYLVFLDKLFRADSVFGNKLFGHFARLDFSPHTRQKFVGAGM